MENALAPLLQRMADGKSPGDKVVPILTKHFEKVAKILRTHLAEAGIARAELFELSKTREPIDFRTWRDSGITHLALRRTGLEE
jgi:hypothetical protein